MNMTVSPNRATLDFNEDEAAPLNCSPSEQISYAGKHLIVDFWGAQHLRSVEMIDKALKDATSAADATLLHIHLHKFSGEGGVTGVALLAESHISIHTWPEHNYAALDVFMCGGSAPEKSIAVLEAAFQPTRVEISELLRGSLSDKVLDEKQ